MLRLLLKAVLIVLVLIGVFAGTLFAWRAINERWHDRALARAEAANRAHWESGIALRLKARIVQRSLGETSTREQTLDCFQKQVVSYRRFRGPLTETRSQSTYLKSLFSMHSEERSIYFGPAGTLCSELFLSRDTTDQAAPFSGDIVINPFPSEDMHTFELLMLRQGPACRLRWTASKPLNLDHNIHIDALTIQSVEEVPLRSVLQEPDHMGSADDTILRLMGHIGTGRLDTPARYDWNADELCWMAPDTDRCDTRGDDLCGIPKL